LDAKLRSEKGQTRNHNTTNYFTLMNTTVWKTQKSPKGLRSLHHCLKNKRRSFNFGLQASLKLPFNLRSWNFLTHPKHREPEHCISNNIIVYKINTLLVTRLEGIWLEHRQFTFQISSCLPLCKCNNLISSWVLVIFINY